MADIPTSRGAALPSPGQLRQALAQRNGAAHSAPPPAGPASPTSVPAPVVPAQPSEATPGVLPVGYEVVAELRKQAGIEISKETADKPALDEADRRQHGRSVIRRTVSAWAAKYATTARPLTADEERLLQDAVYNELFKAGRLQPLLDDPGVENILINGCDRVRVDYCDRPSAVVDPIAGSDRELIDLINHLGRTQGSGERALTPATPMLNMRLGDGSRLAASHWITPRPQVAIRRHRTRQQALEHLVEWGTIDSTIAEFIRALVKARKNVVFVGSQGVGKTSLLRAAAREIPRTERVGTLESEYELYLHEDPDGPEVVAFEGRESNGERGPDGKPLGEVTLSDMFPQALRMSLRRVIVGEVRSREVVPMLHAMNEGEGGSMCTLHARDPKLAIERLATLCLEAGIGMTTDLAYRLIAGAINFIVYVRLVDETEIGGRKHRFVSHIMEITGIGEGNRPSHQMVFGPREAGDYREPRAVPQLMPACIGDLERVGFHSRLLTDPWGAWEERPIKTVMPL